MTLEEAVRMYIEATDDACLFDTARMKDIESMLGDFAVYVRECQIRITT